MDGTKIEADANRYTFVWGKAVSKHKTKLQEEVHALFADIEMAEEQEEQENQGKDLAELGIGSEVNSEKLEQVVQKLEVQLAEKPKDKPLKKAVRKLRKDLLPRLLKYEQYQKLLGDRKSVYFGLQSTPKTNRHPLFTAAHRKSKTDPWEASKDSDCGCRLRQRGKLRLSGK